MMGVILPVCFSEKSLSRVLKDNGFSDIQPRDDSVLSLLRDFIGSSINRNCCSILYLIEWHFDILAVFAKSNYP